MKPTKLNLISLEQRAMPATFGIPWQDASQLTLSFVPDGTLVGSQTSTLNAMMGKNSSSDWQGEILRAFQTWAVQSNINIGLVSDDGSPLTAGGSVQGNAGFGDIRIAGVPLASDVYAITAPPDMYSAWSGTILINTNKLQNKGSNSNAADIYSMMLHEAGHALGVSPSTSTSSVMYDYYSGVRAGLSAEDITSIQSLYGVRTADQYDLTTNNGSRTTATSFPFMGVSADITSTGDVDWYRFSASSTSLVVKLETARVSLLNAVVNVLDSTGKVIATGKSASIFNNSIELNLSNLVQGGTYFVQVLSARTDVFGVGSYRLRIGTSSSLSFQDSTSAFLTNLVMPEFVANDTITSATSLFNPEKTVSNASDMIFSGQYGKAGDVDFYSIQAPTQGTAIAETLVVSIWGLNGAVVDPNLDVFDASGNAVQFKVMNQTATNCVIQVTNIVPGTKYFIRTSSSSGLVGTYRMAINFMDATLPAPEEFSGSLSTPTSTATTSITLDKSSYIHLTLSSFGISDPSSTVTITIYDSLNKVVATLVSGPNGAQSFDLFLKAGNYRVEVGTTSWNPLNFTLFFLVTTDPVGLLPTSSTTTTTTTTTTSSTSTSTTSTWWGSTSPSYTSSSTTTTAPAY